MKNDIPIDEMTNCALREVKMRKRVYLGEGTSGKGMVGKDKMKLEDAEREIALMQAILDLLLRYKLETANQITPKMIQEYAIIPRDGFQNQENPIAVKLGYIGGLLSEVSNILPAVEVSGKAIFTIPLPNKVEFIPDVAKQYSEYFSYEALKVDSTRDKIGIFCVAFKAQFGKDYAVKPNQARKWKEDHSKTPAPMALMQFYMKCSEFPIAGPKSILDYLRHYESILQLKEKASKDKTGDFPGYFDKSLLSKLASSNPTKYQAYRTHLQSIGFERKQNPSMGEIWVRK